MKRRQFLSSASAAGAVACLAPQSCFGIDPFERPKPATLKLSLAAYSMRQYLAPKANEPNKMDLLSFVDFCQQQGLTGAELTSYYFPEQVTQEYLLKLKRHCHLRGISPSGGAIRNDFCQVDSAKVKADIEHTKKWIDYYALIGAPAIRVFAGKQAAGEELPVTLERCAKNLSVACEYAADKGVILALENHGGVTAYAKDLLAIIEQVDSPALGINFDSGNFRSTDDPYAELAKIAPYAVNAQIKTEVAPNGAKEEADFGRIVSILRDAGYSGWLALEFEGQGAPINEVPKYLTQLSELV
ncbi:MAG: sugar phosphate isomerase/epimerase family protein [Pirellulaceae bacterium]